MPPKTKITREMVLDAAFQITREAGIEAVNARTIAKRLGCSTQPVMYLFQRVEDVKIALYEEVDRFHSEYLMNIDDPENILMGIGLNYIHFAMREPHLFRFLFQSGYATENSLLEMVDSPELAPVIQAMEQAMELSTENTKKVFVSIAVFAHGYASILANNALVYDETLVCEHLDRAYRGAILAIQEEDA